LDDSRAPSSKNALRDAAACLHAFVVALAFACIAVVVGCRDSEPDHTASRPVASRDLVIAVSGDTSGWIVPCGCASNQSGGLLRRGNYVAELRKTSNVVLADAGGAPGGDSPYERARFEAILRGELEMSVAAHNVGAAEAALGADELRRLEKEVGAPFVSANLTDAAGKPIVGTHTIVEAGGRRVFITGVLSPGLHDGQLQASDPGAAVLAVLQQVRDQQFDAVVVLAYCPPDELRALARTLPEAHLVVGGPTGQSLPPEQIGAVLVASATNKGKFLAEFQAPAQPGERWSGKIVEISAAFSDDAKQQANLKQFYDTLEQRDFAATESGFAPELSSNLPEDYRVAGSDSCRDCHTADCDLWHESKHAHAWPTLIAREAHVDSYCQQCHTTGYGLPGGFNSIASTPERVSVGCESCHGPSRKHVADPGTRTPLVARDQCARCHDRENSPQFEFAAYWNQIVHGEKQP
jgi:hypothetical protein